MNVAPGTTNRSEYFRIVSSTTSQAAGSLTVSDIASAYYKRSRSASVEITPLADLEAQDDSHSPGGFLEEPNMAGVYRFDVPNAAYAVGSDEVIVQLNMEAGYVCQPIKHQLVDIEQGETGAVDNTRVVEARVIKLSRRADGTAGGVRPIRMVAGSEKLPWWIDPSPFTGGEWLSDVISAVSSNDSELEVTASGVNRELAVVHLDATDAVAGETYTLTVDIEPAADQLLRAEIEVEALAPAAEEEAS